MNVTLPKARTCNLTEIDKTRLALEDVISANDVDIKDLNHLYHTFEDRWETDNICHRIYEKNDVDNTIKPTKILTLKGKKYMKTKFGIGNAIETIKICAKVSYIAT